MSSSGAEALSASMQNQLIQASHETLTMLEVSKAKIENLIDGIPNAFAIINEEGTILKGNRFLAELMGVDVEEALHRNLFGVFDEVSAEIFRKSLREGGARELEIPLRDRKGNDRIFAWKVDEFQPENRSSFKGYVVFGSDVTATRENEKRLAQVFSSVPLGIVKVDDKLVIQEPYSQYSKNLLGIDDLSGKSIFDVLFKRVWSTLTVQQQEAVKMLYSVPNNSVIQFELNCEALPSLVQLPVESEGATIERWIGISYETIAFNGIVSELLIVLEDRTEIERVGRENRRSRDEEQKILTRFTALRKLDTQLRETVMEDLSQSFERLEQITSKKKAISIVHALHAIKGVARVGNFEELKNLAHETEAYCLGLGEEIAGNWEGVVESLSTLKVVWREWQLLFRALSSSDEVPGGSARQSSLSGLRPYLSRLVESTADSLGKDVRLDCSIFDQSLDLSCLHVIKETLQHVVTNAIDHGLELPERRKELGKNPQACLNVGLQLFEEDFVEGIVADDGAGLNTVSLKKKADTEGIPYDSGDEKSIWQVIFQDGVSTKDAITTTSGRGVGLAAVRQSIEELGGSIEVSSRPGQGTRFRFVVPRFDTKREK